MPKSWINHIQNIQQEPITTSRMDRTDNEGPNAPKETQHVLHRRAKLQKLPMKTILLKQRDQKNLLCHQHKSRPKELPLGTREKKKLNNTLLTQWPFTANDSLWQLLYIDSWWYLGATTSHPAASLLLESTPWSRLNGNPSCWSSAAHFFLNNINNLQPILLIGKKKTCCSTGEIHRQSRSFQPSLANLSPHLWIWYWDVDFCETVGKTIYIYILYIKDGGFKPHIPNRHWHLLGIMIEQIWTNYFWYGYAKKHKHCAQALLLASFVWIGVGYLGKGQIPVPRVDSHRVGMVP